MSFAARRFSFVNLVIVMNVMPLVCQIPSSSPSITGDSTFSVGDTGSFICSSSGGLPDPSVKWFRNGQLVDDTYALTSGQANTGGTVSNTVSFTVIASDHYAVYECQVDNGVTVDPLKLTKVLLVRSTPNPPTLVGPTNPPPGQQNTWTCTSVGSFPAATMTMRRGNQQYTNEFTTSQQINAATKTWTVTGTLTWTPTVVNNGDILYCDVAHETLTTQQTVNLPLTVVDPLAVNAPVTSYTPTIGTTVTLNCVVTSGTATSIVWLKGNNVLNINANTRYSNGDVTDPPLTITNVQQSDQGNYVCRAANSQSTVNTNTIVVNPQAFPSITVSPTSGSTDIGTATYTITCTVIATPEATSWSWTKTPIGGGQSTTFNQGTNDNKYIVANSASSPSLTIRNIQKSDQANYVCTATNSAGTRSSGPSQLTVTGGLLGVTIAPSNQMVIRGNSQTITCTISGTPAVQAVTWLKNSQTVTIDGSKYSSGGSTNTLSLTITNFQYSDAATYNCRAANAAGATLSPNSVLTYGATNTAGSQYSTPSQLTVTGADRNITVFPTYGSAVIGISTYTVTCTVTLTPQATSWSWTKTPIGGGQSTTINQGTNDNKYTVANSASSPSLTIKNIETSDQANYVCSATNVAGTRSSGPSQLTVPGELLGVTIAPSNQMVIRGNSQTITCTITGTPAVLSVEWRRNDQTVTIDGSKYSSGGSTNSPTLTITNFQSSDAATYNCRAANAVGSTLSPNSVLTYGEDRNITVSPPTGNAVIGTSTYTITCTVTLTPEATSWSWTKTPIGGGQSTTINQGTNDNKYMVANSASSPSLTIKNIQTSDQANYVCSATNTAGTQSSTPSQLTVTGDTVINNELSTDTCNVVKNVLIGIVVVLVIILILHIVVDYWMYRKGYLQCKKKTDYADMQYYIDKHRYNEMSHRIADDNTSHIYNVVF